MKSQKITLVKPQFMDIAPRCYVANSEYEAFIYAGDLLKEQRKLFVKSLMIEDTQLVEENERAYVIEVFYYEA